MVQDKLYEVIKAFGDALVIVWDIETGTELVKNDCEALKGFTFEPTDNVLAMLQAYVHEDDKQVYTVYLSKIMAGMASKISFTPVKERRLNVAVQLGQGQSYSYHKVESYLEKNEQEEIIRIVSVVMPLDTEEIYREHLARTITNDRTPAMFNKVAMELTRKNPDEDFALVQFDVAKFKVVNELYGEAFGDELLNYFISTLDVLCNENQLFVRLTADVFMILTSYESEEELLSFVHRLNDSLLGYKDTNYRLVFGIAKVEDLQAPLRKFGDRAAIARQNSKGDAFEYVGFYRESMGSTILNNKYVEDHMEQALEDGEFVMYLQPKYSIEHNEIVGAEALVRWFSKEKGMLPPDQFIPVLEANGFIKEMDAYIWEEACKTLRNWMDCGINHIPISVNVSRMHLKDDFFIDILNRLTETYNIPKHLLEIEITESSDVNGSILEQINNLKENQYTLLMDDFGSGYSSLNTLKDTKFDVVKIDRGFLQDFIESERGQKIVEHTISMTKAIGLDLVAEGVETKEQAQFLVDCGCNVAQGYYYAKPMPVEEVNKLLKIEN